MAGYSAGPVRHGDGTTSPYPKHGGVMAKGLILQRDGRQRPPHSKPPDGIVDVREIDWNLVWQSLRTRRGSGTRDAAFWDGRASSFAEGASETEYADAFLALMKPEARWTVLDMGCGSGTLAVPLARIVSAVTAVDFSAGMLDVTRARCDAEGLSNLKMVQASWEEDWTAKGIGIHDVAIASRSMVAEDMRTSITKLDSVARKRVYITTIVGDGPYDRCLFDAIGRPLAGNPDYIYTYNLLYQMGIRANVGFITEKRSRAYDDIDRAAKGLYWMVGDLSLEEKEKLAGYLRNGDDTAVGIFHHLTEITWAVIWWEKQGGKVNGIS